VKKILLCAVFLLATGWSGSAFAVQPQVTYRDSRVLGMGGAFVAVADDKNALFYNPAGFASIGLKRSSIANALVNPGEWKPRYRNLPDFTALALNFSFNNALLNEKKQKAFQTLVELGIIPLSVDEANLTYDYYAKHKLAPWFPVTLKQLDHLIFLPGFPIVKIGRFKKYPATNYGWGNLNDAQLADASAAVDALAKTLITGGADAEVFSVAGHYYGFGVFNSFDSRLKVGFRGLVPEPTFSLKEDIITTAGFGMPIPGFKRLHAGIAVKSFVRAQARANKYEDYIEAVTFDWMGFAQSVQPKDWSSWAFKGANISTNRLPKSLNLGIGAGFDLGAMYKLKHGIMAGLQLSDVVTRIRWLDGKRASFVPINARAGISWRPNIKGWDGALASFLFEDPVLAFDMEDLFFNYTDNLFLKMHIGGEFKTFFRTLNVRAGINQGYPTLGLAYDGSFHWLSYIPLVGWFRPDSVYLPQFNMNKRDHCQHHPCCCMLTGLLGVLYYAHLEAELLWYGRELGKMPGLIQDQQIGFRAAVSWSF
jgi:hypothetical protein